MNKLEKTKKDFYDAGFNVIPFSTKDNKGMVKYTHWYTAQMHKLDFEALPLSDNYKVLTQFYNPNGVLACLDFDIRDDNESVYEEFAKQIDIKDFKKTVVTSPSGGKHIWLKVIYPDGWGWDDENQSMREFCFDDLYRPTENYWNVAYDENNDTIIELKTGGKCNLTIPYSKRNDGEYKPEIEYDNFVEAIPTISSEDFDKIIELIAKFNKKDRTAYVKKEHYNEREYSGDLYGFMAYNEAFDIDEEIEKLEATGLYSVKNETKEKILFTRIGGKDNNSSVEMYVDSGVSVHYSVSDELYDYTQKLGKQGLTPFDRLVYFEYNSDAEAAKKDMLKQFPNPEYKAYTTVEEFDGYTGDNGEIYIPEYVNATQPLKQQEAADSTQTVGTPEEEGIIRSPAGYHRMMTRKHMRNRPKLPMMLEDNFRRGQVGMLVGQSQSRKTFLAISLMYAAMLEHKFLNKFQFNDSYRVLYNPGEDSESINTRLSAIEQKLTPEQLEIVDNNLLFDDMIVQLSTGANVNDFIALYKDRNVDIVVIDTFSRATLGAEENSATAMNAVMGNAYKIARELDCYVLLIHHTKKDGDGYRGNSAIEGALDQIYSITWDKETNYGKVLVEKMKNHAFWGPIGLKQEIVTLPSGDTSLILHPVDTIEIPLNAEASLFERMSQYLKLNPNKFHTCAMLEEVFPDATSDNVRSTANRLAKKSGFIKKEVDKNDTQFSTDFRGKSAYMYQQTKDDEVSLDFA